MSRAGFEPTDESALEPALRASEMGNGRVTGKLGVALLVIAVGYAVFAFAGKAAPGALLIWTSAFAVVLSAWIGALFWMSFRPATSQSLTRFWLPLVKGLAVAANILVAASVWIFLPVAGPDLHALMTLLYIWFIVVQIMAETEASSVSRSAILLVMGSLVAHELANPRPTSIAFVFFMLMFGASMLAFRELIRRSTVEAIRARLVAEHIGKALNTALQDVAAQRDAIRRFLASASHDLQQPVQAASLFFDQAITTGEVSARHRAVEGARRAFASAQDLLNEMLEHLRLESGVVAPRIENVALLPLLSEILLELELQAKAAGMSFKMVPTQATVSADPALLRRVIRNLMVNALVHSHGSRLLIGVRRSHGPVLVHVIDNGRGVSSEGSTRLFEEVSGASHAPGNHGLGLITARRLALAMGGEVTLDRRWKKGACFVVRLAAAHGHADVIETRDYQGTACAAA